MSRRKLPRRGARAAMHLAEGLKAGRKEPSQQLAGWRARPELKKLRRRERLASLLVWLNAAAGGVLLGILVYLDLAPDWILYSLGGCALAVLLSAGFTRWLLPRPTRRYRMSARRARRRRRKDREKEKHATGRQSDDHPATLRRAIENVYDSFAISFAQRLAVVAGAVFFLAGVWCLGKSLADVQVYSSLFGYVGVAWAWSAYAGCLSEEEPEAQDKAELSSAVRTYLEAAGGARDRIAVRRLRKSVERGTWTLRDFMHFADAEIAHLHGKKGPAEFGEHL